MRWPLLTGVALTLISSTLLARSIPDPHQQPAPGNEAAQTPIARAGYSVATNYQLQCAGCHLTSGEGSSANDTPRLAGFVGNFLKVEGGRAFLVRVPGMSQSALNNQQLADMLNWLLNKDGMAGASMPEHFQPYSADEVAAVRQQAMLNLPQTRGKLIEQMKAQGISITDGLGD